MKNSPILLAVSGGIDSMVMLHRLHAQYGPAGIAVAHCNFQLRGSDSDADEILVKETCEKAGIQFHVQRFDTGQTAKERGKGIQETARELRYEWFKELMMEFGYSSLATAHHQGDSIETFFINLLRGSGPKGLAGIKDRKDKGIIRPLMDMDRGSIERYAQQHSVQWREDESNSSDKYLRNRIRNEMLPLLRDLRPGVDEVMLRNIKIQSQLDTLLQDALVKFRAEHVSEENGTIRIDSSDGEQHVLLLHSFLYDYGFSSTQIENMIDASQGGKQAISATHVLTSHRGGLLLSPLKELPQGPWLIDESIETTHLPFSLTIQRLYADEIKMQKHPEFAYIDLSKISFPLTIRPWKEGDSFQPLGMNGKKKVSDFLVDNKIPVEEKKRTNVMISGSEIIWLMGHRISELYKVDESSNQVLFMSLSEKD